jgi:Na+/melibiose symporter-like transporter
MTSVLPCFNILAAVISREPVITVLPGTCQQAKQNWVAAIAYLKLPSMYKPMIFIFLVVVAPGVTDAMFYYESNVLGFSPKDFGLLGVVSCCASICGVWAYRIWFTKTKLVKYFLVITLILCAASLTNLLIVSAKGSGINMALGQQFAYGFVNELHLMPLMIIAC